MFWSFSPEFYFFLFFKKTASHSQAVTYKNSVSHFSCFKTFFFRLSMFDFFRKFMSTFPLNIPKIGLRVKSKIIKTILDLNLTLNCFKILIILGNLISWLFFQINFRIFLKKVLYTRWRKKMKLIILDALHHLDYNGMQVMVGCGQCYHCFLCNKLWQN